MSAALHGRDGALRMLLNRGVKPDPLSVPARWTPLMFAAAGESFTYKWGSRKSPPPYRAFLSCLKLIENSFDKQIFLPLKNEKYLLLSF